MSFQPSRTAGQGLRRDSARSNGDAIKGRRRDSSYVAVADSALLEDLAALTGSSYGPYLRNLKTLPVGTKPIAFVGEGAANAVFALQLPSSHPDGSKFTHFLLRVSKLPNFNYLHQQKFFHAKIQPRLGQYALHQELVSLHGNNLIDKLNHFLTRVNESRKKRFQNSLIVPTDWAFLVEDMRPPDYDEYMLVEFKPKWLVQSPSAPENAVRCRQCARELRSFVVDPGNAKQLPNVKPCPLLLGRQKLPSHDDLPRKLAPDLAGKGLDSYLESSLRRVATCEALRNLKSLQEDLDPLGPLRASENPEFPLAMTLRDCTCFAWVLRRARASSEMDPLKVRLGDLDWKDPSLKMDHWQTAERDLIDGGFYTANVILSGGSFYQVPTGCQLEKSRRFGREIKALVAVDNGSEVNAKPSDLDETKFAGASVFYHRTDTQALQLGLRALQRDMNGFDKSI